MHNRQQCSSCPATIPCNCLLLHTCTLPGHCLHAYVYHSPPSSLATSPFCLLLSHVTATHTCFLPLHPPLHQRTVHHVALRPCSHAMFAPSCQIVHLQSSTLMRYAGKPCAKAAFEAVCARYQERQQASNRIVHYGCTLCSLEPSSLATSPFCLLLSHVTATHLLLAVVPLGHQN